MLKYIKASLIKNKFIGAIFIIQLLLGTIGLAQISYYIDYIRYTEKNAEILNVPKENIYDTRYGGGSFEYSKSDAFVRGINKELGEETIGVYNDTYSFIVNIENYDKYKKKRDELSPYLKEYGEECINNIQVTNPIYKCMDLKIVKGRGLTKEDFKKVYNGEIPMIISEEFEDIINIGDKIKVQVSRDYFEVFEIVGIFEKNSEWFSQDFLNAELKNLNTSFISVFNYKKENPNVENLFHSLYLFNNGGLSDEEFRSKLRELENKNSEILYIKSAKEIIEEKYINNKEGIISTFILGSVLVIFTLFSIGIVSFYIMKNKKSEIGLLKVIGIKTKKIKLIIVLEWTIYLVISLILSIGVAYFNNKAASGNLKDNLLSITDLARISYSSLIIIWLGIGILVISVVYCSSKRIIDKQITELIKGVE